MVPGETGLLSRNPSVARRALTVAEYHRMGEVGIGREAVLEPELLPGVTIPIAVLFR